MEKQMPTYFLMQYVLAISNIPKYTRECPIASLGDYIQIRNL